MTASANVILQKRPKETVSIPYAVRSCVSYPFAILLGHPMHVNITVVDGSYRIFCHMCRLTNYIDSILDKKLSVIILVKRPPYIMLPVDLMKDWYENSALQILKSLHALIRTKRFVAALILGISALIAIITTFAVATTALVQEIHTAHFVNELNKNVTLALSEQSLIDKKLKAKINVLEEVVLALGQDLVNIQNRLETRCHTAYQYIYVTPLPYNTSQSWEKVKNHLQGV